jgi:hypothetical protein
MQDNSPWKAAVGRARGTFESEYVATASPRRVNRLLSVRGVVFFDVLHGQLGVAPNGIELHPVLDLCFDQGCALRR